MPDLSPLRLARREKILEAAETVFSKCGFRAATIEGIALSAVMSKVTIYGYFTDKEAVFEAVAARVAARLCDSVANVLNRQGDIIFRLESALTCKHLMVWDLVKKGGFASELFVAKSKYAAETFKTLDETIETLISKHLKAAGIASPKSQARILFAAANGIANRAASKSYLKKDIKMLVRSVLSENG